MTDIAESLHFDRGQVFKWEETPEGYLRVHMRIARTGELTYYNKDGSERVEVVTPEVLFSKESTDSFKNKYITHPNHPPEMLSDQNDERMSKYKRGMTGTLITKEITTDGDFLGIVGTITHPQAKRDVIEGITREVSCGYMAGTRQRSDGKHDQLYRRGNHITLCPKGRAGSEVRVSMDSAEDSPQLEVFVSEPIRTDEAIMTTTTVNPTAPTLETITLKLDEFESINVPLAYAKPISDRFKRDADTVASVKTRIKALEDELATEKQRLAGMTSSNKDTVEKLDSLTAALKATGFDSIEALAKEKDSQTARADQLADEVKQLKETPAKPALDSAELMTAVKARRELERKCDGLLPKDFNIDEATDRTLREAVILNKSSLSTLEGRNDAYVEARFDAIVEAHENRDTTQPLAASARQASSTPPKTEQRADTAAWLEMVQAMTNPTAATAS